MKPTHHIIYSTLIIALLSLFIPHGYVNAQTPDDRVQSLGEILNPKADEQDPSKTPKDRGNAYFKNCMATESLAFDEDEKELLCACTSSKVGEILTGEDFAHLYKDTLIGKEARMKMIAFAYTDCMEYAIKRKVYKDCRVLPIMKMIRHGKSHVCKCTAGHFDKLINSAAAKVIMDGVKYHPMTLNPLEYYFTTDGYYKTLEGFGKVCRAQMVYYKHN